jgi:hypothetical protein
MGGFIPTCHTQPSGEVAKQEKVMDFRVPGNRQTPWACGPNGAIWYANLHTDIEDQIVIENAKRIVDKALPQKQSTFFGGHYYSFLTREYLLSLLLFHFQEHGLFPTGSVCIVDQWAWDSRPFRHKGKWFTSWTWRFGIRRSELKSPGYWVQIPSLLSVLSGTSVKPNL